MGELLLRRWWLVVIRGIAAILFGLISLIWPSITLLVLVVVFACYVLFDGVVALTTAVADKLSPPSDRWLMAILGLISVLAGVLALAWPGITALALLFVIAFWAILTGALHIATGWRIRKLITNEWLLFASGTLAILLGVLLLIFPGEGALALIVTIAIFALVWGAVLVLLGIRLRGLGKELSTAAG